MIIKSRYLRFFCVIGFLLIIVLNLDIKAYGLSNVERYAGKDRYETAIKISQKNWDKSDNVVIASGNDFADAICSSPLAYKYNAPILLVNSRVIREDIIKEIKRLEAKNIFIVGGAGVISQNIENQIKDLKIEYERIYGKDRYETSVKVAEYIGTDNGVILASAQNFVDAMSIAPIASNLQMPILLSEKDYFSDSVDNFIKDEKTSKFYVIGGTSVLSNEITEKITNYKRLAGKDRYDTNLKVINEFIDDINLDNVYIATGKDFPDALASSSSAAKDNSIIFLTDNRYSSNEEVLRSKLSKIQNIKVLGGASTVSKVTMNKILYGNDAKIFLGYATKYYSTDNFSYNSILRNTDLIDQISTDTYKTDTLGNLSGQAPKEILEYANKNGIISFAMVTNSFSGYTAKRVLESFENRKRLINNIELLLKQNGYQGVNIDFEGIYYYNREYFTTFIRELYENLHSKGYLLIVSVPAKTRDNLRDGWNGAFDYKNLAKYADQIQIMTYDEHYINGSAGPIASIKWFEDVVRYASIVIPKEKISLGLAAYGYDWSSSGNKAYSINKVYSVAAYNNVSVKFDSVSKSPYYNYIDDRGVHHSVWFENSESISYKLNIADKYNIKGISMWKLGLEDNNYIKVINNYLNFPTWKTAATGNDILLRNSSLQ